ncbi:MAG: arylsulfatase [Aureliella sp.]
MLDRRWFSMGVGFLCLFAPCSIVESISAAERPPNIVFVLADDLGYRELGCFGQQLIQTPHLDDLAKHGMRLTQHYSGNAVCAPSRCVLMTGKHPGHTSIRNNSETESEGQWPLAASDVTVATLLQQHGYSTGAFGKWGLGGPQSEGRPLQQGFDRFYGYNCQRVAHSYYPATLWSDEELAPLDNHPAIAGHGKLALTANPADPASYAAFKGTDYAPDRIHAQALEFIDVHRERPFFLYYPSVIPHLSLQIPDAELAPYTDLGWYDPPFKQGSQKLGYTPHLTPRAAYAAMISKLDKQVGSLLAKLDELGLSEDTIVIFTSDNGASHLRDEVDVDFFKSVGELRGLKGSLYEGGLRVPTLVRWPKHIAPGSDSDIVSGFEDWLPTLLDCIGQKADIPNDCDGISLLPTLLGQSQAPRPYLYREFAGYGGQQSLRIGPWKAVRQGIQQGNMDVELYNIDEDISETRNVAAEHPRLVAKLTAQMTQVRTPSATFPLLPYDTQTPASP